MSSELIRSALQTATDTKVVVAEPGAVSATPQVFRDCFADATAIVVGDERTMTVAGNAVVAELTAAGIAQLDAYVFPGSPELYADMDNCHSIRDSLAERGEAIPVAVGAGTQPSDP